VNRYWKPYRTILASLALILTLTGCGGTAATTAAPAPATIAPSQPQSVSVKLSSFKIEPSAVTAKAGAITFDVTNGAPDVQHEFVVVKLDKAGADLPYDAAANEIDEAKVNSPGEVPELDPGAKGSITLTLAPGNYLFLCNIAAHYKSGMVTTFTVTP
jgi:uncharacterized cupredoxin-like copper-binding protein